MELLKLNAQNQAGPLIENWDSLIWTERFNTVGDFQLITGDIQGFMQMIPEGTALTLRESNIVMIAETHQIDRKKNSPATLTITGRSYESILDRRVSIPSVDSLTGSNPWLVNTKTPSDLAYYIMYDICVNGIIDLADIFPAAQVQFPAPADYLASTGPVKEYDVPRGSLLGTVLGLLQTEAPEDISTVPVTPKVIPHGIRAVRPNAAGTAIALEIYTGVDRSSVVRFDGTRDLLDDGTYLFSKVGSANAAYGVGPNTAATMFEGAVEPTGLDRRVVLVDASQSGNSDLELLRHYMSQGLSEAHETAMFDGSVNQDLSPYVYGVDFNLGDIVHVVGDYGLVENAQVTEYIRSEDLTGFRAYPTLSTIVT